MKNYRSHLHFDDENGYKARKCNPSLFISVRGSEGELCFLAAFLLLLITTESVAFFSRGEGAGISPSKCENVRAAICNP